MKGIIISIEGTDGAGKHTQQTLLGEGLKNLGYTAVRLAVEINHLPAIKLYENCGFVKVGSHFMYEHNYYLYEFLMYLNKIT